ncbi:site-specific integrase [Actinomadura sp. LOL_016]|uniref:site-specific integrase n=1 Tax=unclassified Actinomadura TaxID=2626254 RepID=UPI003A80B3EE
MWTAAQTAEFLDAIGDHRLYAAYHLIALRGLRRGEAAGLRWCDVDLEQGVAAISQQIQQHQGHLTACPPKTASSARVIALDRTTVSALRAHRDLQQKDRQQAGEACRDSGYVFTRPSGDPLGPDRLSCIFRTLIAEHGLPPIRLHDLRHGAVTLALAAGVELKVVQDMFGHSTKGTPCRALALSATSTRCSPPSGVRWPIRVREGSPRRRPWRPRLRW